MNIFLHRDMSRLVSVVLVGCFAVIGCRDANSRNGADIEDDPQALVTSVFHEMQAAILREDWTAAFSYLMPKEQRSQLNDYIFRIEQQSSQAGPQVNKDFHDFLTRNRISSEIPTVKENDAQLQQRFAKVSSIPATLAALIGWVKKHEDKFLNKSPLDLKKYRQLAKAEVMKISVRDDLAIVTIRFEHGAMANITFLRVKNDWALAFHLK